MPDLDRTVAGLRCRDVLGLLAEFVDRELDPETHRKVTDHLAGCDTCEKFGEEYAALVAQLRAGRTRLSADAGVRARLAERMSTVWAEDDA